MASAHLRTHWQSSRKAHFNPFQTFLERLSQEVEEEQLESLKFLLEEHIPAGTLEKCTTPRKLFKCMKQYSLLGYNKLDFLEELLKVAQRSDLVEIVKDFKPQPTKEFDSGYPGFFLAMEKVCLSFTSQRQHFNVQNAVDALVNKLSSALKVNLRDCHFIHCEEVVSNWFNLTLELPKRKEVLDQLCFDALDKAHWLTQCGVKVVKIGDKSEIHVQSLITPSVLIAITPGADLPCTEDPSPSYVVARGPRAVEAFIQAIKAGKILDKRVKVLVIGQDRVGKTSVVRSLKGEPFRDNETSTDGVKMHEALENPGSKPWKDSTMQKETTAYHYKCAECICKELQSEPQARNSTPEINQGEIHVPRPDTFKEERTTHHSSDLSPDTNQEELPSPDNVEEEITGDEIVYPSSETFQNELRRTVKFEEDISANLSTDNNQNSSDDPLQVDDKIANLTAEKLDKNVSKVSDGIWPVIWDFAGQAVFRAIHPIFMSPEALYVLVCDPTKDFLDTARCMINEDGGEEVEILAADSGDTNLDHILRWMDMVHLLRPSEDSSKIPPVVLVGTHADKSDADKKMSVLKNNLLTSFEVFFKRIAKILTIDNTLSGSPSMGEDEHKHVVDLRKEILSLAENMPHTKTEVPLKWLEVENKVCEHIRESPEKYMTKTNFREKFIHQFYKPGHEDDLEHILNFMHDRGTIVYHGHPENPDDLVVLDPLWLISDVLCKIITAREQKGDEPDILIHRKDLRDKGLLSAVLVHHACKSLELDDIEENIILMMKKFNLLCEFGLDKTGQPVYLVPCMLTRKPAENLMGHVFQGCEPVFITFDTNYVPFGLFSRILVLFGEWAASRTNCERPQLFANAARFVIAECICLGFVCYKTVIKVHIWAMDDSNPVEREPEVLSEVSRCLRESLERLKQECHWLRRVSWKLCGRCKLCKGNHNGECLWHQQRECVHEDCSHYVSTDAKFFCCQHAEGSDLRVPRTWIQAVQRVIDIRGQSWKCVRPGYHPGTNDVYKMTALPRGITLIINNTWFANHPERARQLPRNGSEQDVRQVKALFTDLGFEVRTEQNLTREQLLSVLDRVVVEDHSCYDCFVLWLMSHGKSGEVFCHDGVTIPIQTVHDMISKCRTLYGKPKVVFIQACRGEEEDEGVSIAEETKQTQFSQSQLDSPNVTVKQSSCKEPTHADFLHAFSTVDEYVAYRDRDSGSYYVRGLLEAFRERAFCDHLVDILTVVNQKVSYMEVNRPAEANETKLKICKQMPEVKHTFRKKLLF